jgi:hypothetical protein
MNSDNGCINKPHSQGEYCPICHFRNGNNQIKEVNTASNITNITLGELEKLLEEYVNTEIELHDVEHGHMSKSHSLLRSKRNDLKEEIKSNFRPPLPTQVNSPGNEVGPYFVIVQRENQPVEVIPFTNRDECVKHANLIGLQWSEIFAVVTVKHMEMLHPVMNEEEARKLCDTYHRALHAMKTYSSVGDGPTRPSEGIQEAQAAEDAIVSALVPNWGK